MEAMGEETTDQRGMGQLESAGIGGSLAK